MMRWVLALLLLSALAACESPSREPVDQSRAGLVSSIPILSPSTPLENPVLVVEAQYYALSGTDHGATITIQGTRTAHRVEGVTANPRTPIRKTRGFVSVNEGIRTASWIEDGIAYTVDVECSDRTDDRCKDSRFVRGVAESLVTSRNGGR